MNTPKFKKSDFEIINRGLLEGKTPEEACSDAGISNSHLHWCRKTHNKRKVSIFIDNEKRSFDDMVKSIIGDLMCLIGGHK